MFLRIETLPKKLLIGQSIEMTLMQNKTAQLWGSFMPRRKEIKNPISSDLYSMQVYDPNLEFKDFTPETPFTKWAAVAVDSINNVPDAMSSYELDGGLYAVFLHKGSFNEFRSTFEYIFAEWIPNSEYEVDRREHFELLGEKYKNNHPDSEEEIWVPIKPKA
ncbi:GyrI-like domain-containing protein [Reichenbachiella ulvae]|uniref:GyrI-like domain-containing protein n=1 Tax=Reichenbachiella ulvae TaxID=2980104 RepID=A0ABT3CXI3_9BACT|nr:GyrI-like domain-containing protein [Reichenbachiella ulvae]MCV9388291.1 GyrI-like domain-containing protein [Reichenbachiella ulvae]